jgi:hypothetical protein
MPASRNPVEAFLEAAGLELVDILDRSPQRTKSESSRSLRDAPKGYTSISGYPSGLFPLQGPQWHPGQKYSLCLTSARLAVIGCSGGPYGLLGERHGGPKLS